MKLSRPQTLFDGFSFSEKAILNTINLIGVPFDETASFRKGAALGPEKIREVSDQIETYSPYLNLDLLNIKLTDLGNIKSTNHNSSDDFLTQLITFYNLLFPIQDKFKILTIGGEHSISIAPIINFLKRYKNLTVLHLDAHADLRDGYQNHKYSHASVIRRAIDQFDIEQNLIQFGIRSGTKEEFSWMRKHQTIKHSIEELDKSISVIPNDFPIYLTIDVDFFDPCFVPGTGTPEAGGENFNTFIKIIKLLENKFVVGADVVELAPQIDPTGNSAIFASKLIRELILLLGRDQ